MMLSSAKTYYILDAYRYCDVDFNSNTIAYCGTTTETESIVIPDKIGTKTVVQIDNYVFENNTVIKSIDMSQTEHLTAIGTGAFYGCNQLEALIVPDSVQYLSEFMLQNCTALKTLEISAGPMIIPVEMCNGCSSLESFSVPETVTKIRRYAFGSCTSLNYVTIPTGVTEIDPSAFYNCPNLTLGVWYGSYGYEYAKERNIPYTLLDNVKLCDTDGDGAVNINDVTALQRCLAELEELDAIHLHAADVNRDGAADITDATVLQEYLAEYDVPYPIGEIITQ